MADMTTYTMNPRSIVIFGADGKKLGFDLESMVVPSYNGLYDIDLLHDVTNAASEEVRNYSAYCTFDQEEAEAFRRHIQKAFDDAFGPCSPEGRESLKFLTYGDSIIAEGTRTLTDDITEFCDAINGGILALEKAKVQGPFDLFTFPVGNRKARRARGSRKQVNDTDIRSVQREKKFRDPYSQKRNTRL